MSKYLELYESLKPGPETCTVERTWWKWDWYELQKSITLRMKLEESQRMNCTECGFTRGHAPDCNTVFIPRCASYKFGYAEEGGALGKTVTMDFTINEFLMRGFG